MRRLLALAALAALAACSQKAPTTAAPEQQPAAPAAATQPEAPPQTAAPPPAQPAQSETQQATRSQESGGEEADHEAKSDASLEKMTSLPSQMPEGKWKAGINYDPIVPAQPTGVSPGHIEVLEVFWLGCPHCYDLEPFIRGWLKSKPAYVDFVRVPVIWQPVHRAHARLYYTIEALGRPGLFEKAFDTIHQLEQNRQPPLVGDTEEETFRLQQAFAVKNGVSADDFAKAYNSFSVNSQLQRAEEATQRFHVEGVPFIVVNGKYSTDIGKAGGEAKLIDLINDLVAAEHGH
jgi:thiol:disulfide interchange protein DsbA